MLEWHGDPSRSCFTSSWLLSLHMWETVISQAAFHTDGKQKIWQVYILNYVFNKGLANYGLLLL